MMVFPTSPLPLITEMLINGVWTDVTSRRRSISPERGLTITRGRQDWGSRVVASRCAQAFENADGFFSNRLPTSPNFGLLGRNVQLRHRVRQMIDSFTRTLSNSWGSTEDADPMPWVLSGGTNPGDYDVDGAFATQTLGSVNVRRTAMASVPGVRDVTMTFKASAVATGAPFTVWLAIGSDINNFYTARPVLLTDGTVRLDLLKWVGGVESNLHPDGLPGVIVGTYGVGTSWGVRLRWGHGGFLSAKAWTTDEPDDWTISTVVADKSLSDLDHVGLFSRAESGNTNVSPVISFGGTEATSFRFWGESAAFAPQWKPKGATGTDVTVPVEATGILQRLGASRRPLQSPLYRTMSGVAPGDVLPLAYWPCEDGSDAQSIAAATIGAEPATITGPVDFASHADLAGSAPLMSVPVGSRCDGVVPAYPNPGATAQWLFQFVMKIDVKPAVNTDYAEVRVVGVGNGMVTGRITLQPGVGTADLFLNCYDASGTLIIGTGVPIGGAFSDIAEADFYGKWFMYAAVGYFDPFFPGQFVLSFGYSGNGFAGTSGGSIETGPAGQAVGWSWLGAPDSAVGHMGVFVDPNFSASTASLDNAAALDGWAGETAAERLARLCREERIPFDLIGDPADTKLMGPQRIATKVDLLFDCADVDQGILFEPRDWLAIAYRTGASLYNQTGPDVDYAAGVLAPPFQPVEDDQLVINDPTVNRRGGSSARFEVTEGPLSTQDPPSGVGTGYDPSLDMSLFADDQCLPLAQLIGNRGTWDEARYPVARFEMSAPDLVADAELSAQLAALDIGDVFTVSNRPPWEPPGPAGLMAQGTTEFIGDGKDWSLSFNCTPSGPYATGTFDDGVSRYDSDVTTTAEALDTTETGVDIATEAGSAPWVTTASNPAEFPFPIVIGGEEMNVTASVSTGANTYTLTVTRSVNGVVKSHASGAPVHVKFPGRYAY